MNAQDLQPTPTNQHASGDDTLANSQPPRRSLLEQVERTWLGRSARSLDDRLLESADSIRVLDDPSDACWRCASSVGPYETDAEGCSACRSRKLPWARAIRLGQYDGELRQAVHDLKYHAWRTIGLQLGHKLGATILDRLGHLDPAAVAIVPVPTTRLRRLTRNAGVDHTLTLARGLSAATDFPIARLLTRRHRPSQTGLSTTARQQNVQKAFSLAPNAASVRKNIPFRALILLDDVRTSGATLTAAARALDPILGKDSERIPIIAATVAVAGRPHSS